MLIITLLISNIPDATIDINKTKEAIACVIKYFIAASFSYGFLFFLINGIKDNKFISSPIHIKTQDFEVIVIRVPLIREVKNKNLEKLTWIKKREGNTLI